MPHLGSPCRPRRTPFHPLWPAIVGLVAACIVTDVDRVAAQTDLAVASNTAGIEFAAQLAFAVETDLHPDEELFLFYTLDGRGPTNRRIPVRLDPLPGRPRRFQHDEPVARGQIPPATLIEWWWVAETRAGGRRATAPRSVLYLDERFEWQVLEGPRLDLWSYAGSLDETRRLSEMAHAALETPLSLLGDVEVGPLRVVAYRSREDMLPALVDRGQAYESRLITLGARVGPGVILVLARPDDSELASVLAHEMSHVVLHAALAKPYLSAPLWLDEGLAMLAEGPLEPDEERLLASAIREDRLLSLRALATFPGQTDLVPLAYVQSRDVVDFLVTTHGVEPLRLAVRQMGSGTRTHDEALVEAYGMDQSELYAAYRTARGLGPPSPPTPDTRPPQRHRSPGPCAPALLALALPWALFRRR